MAALLPDAELRWTNVKLASFSEGARRVVFERIRGVELDHRVRGARDLLHGQDVLNRALIAGVDVDRCRHPRP